MRQQPGHPERIAQETLAALASRQPSFRVPTAKAARPDQVV